MQDRAAMTQVPASRYAIYAGIALAGCAVDLVSKWWAFSRLGPPPSPSHWLIDEVFGFTTSLNEGALFGIGQGRGFVFCALSIAAVAAILWWLFIARAATDLHLCIALAIVTGGILGNLYDRFGLPALTWGAQAAECAGERVYAVRDWIHFKIEPIVDWPIFNIADCLLVGGAALLIIHSTRGEKIARGASQS
jgi:signal peptidase II